MKKSRSRKITSMSDVTDSAERFLRLAAIRIGSFARRETGACHAGGLARLGGLRPGE